MNIIDSIVLGAVQGLTEFIPVSSSGHLVLAERILGVEVPHVFSILINLGTLLALAIHFRHRLIDIFCSMFREKSYRLIRNVFISTVPIIIAGFLLEDFFAGSFIQQPMIVAIMLFLIGICMIFLNRMPKAKDLDSMEDMNMEKAGMIGLAQVLALIPGTSRSGVTMIAGRLAGLDYKRAAEYSFLLSMPLMFGVILKGLVSGEGMAFIHDYTSAFIVSNVVSFITGLLAVKFMLDYLSRGNFVVFGYYRVVLACLIVVVILL